MYPVETISIDIIWRRAAAIEHDLNQLIPSFYRYQYDGSSEYLPVNNIAYGGSVFNALYIYGNAVSWFIFLVFLKVFKTKILIQFIV